MVTNPPNTVEQAPPLQEECTHHWVIDQPNGPTSTGVCRVCEKVREFKNSPEEHGFNEKGKKNRIRGTYAPPVLVNNANFRWKDEE